MLYHIGTYHSHVMSTNSSFIIGRSTIFSFTIVEMTFQRHLGQNWKALHKEPKLLANLFLTTIQSSKWTQHVLWINKKNIHMPADFNQQKHIMSSQSTSINQHQSININQSTSINQSINQSNQIKSNQIKSKSNQIKIKSNQTKSNQIKSINQSINQD